MLCSTPAARGMAENEPIHMQARSRGFKERENNSFDPPSDDEHAILLPTPGPFNTPPTYIVRCGLQIRNYYDQLVTCDFGLLKGRARCPGPCTSELVTGMDNETTVDSVHKTWITSSRFLQHRDGTFAGHDTNNILLPLHRRPA
ncbi:hypothetical protein LSAT2_024988 [Lamellibrachia satsuma]|nr:hypothetical protein LSAT2_024988 [Lamellibrachia satsuma]